MTDTHVKILDKEAVSNVLYFGAFHRMFVYFHNTHEAACESLHNLEFCSQYVNVWTLYTIIFSSILKFMYCFNNNNNNIYSL